MLNKLEIKFDLRNSIIVNMDLCANMQTIIGFLLYSYLNIYRDLLRKSG